MVGVRMASRKILPATTISVKRASVRRSLRGPKRATVLRSHRNQLGSKHAREPLQLLAVFTANESLHLHVERMHTPSAGD